MTKASTVFKSYVSGPNFMTPDPIVYGFIGKHWVYEINTGTGIMGEALWGVSVIDRRTGKPDHDMSEFVSNREAAYEWVEAMREEQG